MKTKLFLILLTPRRVICDVFGQDRSSAHDTTKILPFPDQSVVLTPSWALNSRWEVTFINKAAEQVLSCTREEVIGKNLWDYFPRSREGRFYTEYERAMTERVSAHFEELYAPLGVWGSMSVYPTKEGIAVYFVDITERKKIQEKIYNDGQNLRAIIPMLKRAAEDLDKVIIDITTRTDEFV